MKKGWKIFWIVCGSCAGIGVVLCAIAFAMGVTVEAIEDRFPDGFTFPFHIRTGYIGRYFIDDDDDDEIRRDTAVSEGDNLRRFENVRSIDLFVSAGEVIFRTAEKGDSDITVKTENIHKRLKLKYYMDGDTLTFRTRKNVSGIHNAGGVGKIYIYVPEDFSFDEAELDVGAGTLDVDVVRARELSVDVGAGEASIDSFEADEADLGCGTGTIKAAGDVRDEAELDCGIGSITFDVKGQEEDYNYDISCGIGEVVCGGATYSGVGCDREIDNGSAREINIDCGIGNVTVNFIS